MIRIRLRKSLARAAMFVYLLTISPVYAMAEIEHREMNRPAIVQMVSFRQRHRALDRHYGYHPVTYRLVF